MVPPHERYPATGGQTVSPASTPDAARPVLRESGAVLLVSCYELGHQPLGIAWPKAFLERAGYTPDLLDLAIEPWDDAKIRRARLVGIAVPMHTALAWASAPPSASVE